MIGTAAFLLLAAVPAEPTAAPPATASALLPDVDRVAAGLTGVRRQATEALPLAARLTRDATMARDQAGRLQAERDALAAYCHGAYDPAEFARRKARCDAEVPALDAELKLARDRLATLTDLLRQQRRAAAAIAAQSVALGQEQTTIIERASSLPGGAAAQACPTSAVAWGQCVRTAICAVVATRAERTRQAIEATRGQIGANQRELDHWTRLNGKAQKEALLAGVKFLAGQYAAGGALQSQKLERLRREADRLAAKYGKSTKAKVRAMYARELYDKVVRMRDPTRDLMLRLGVGTALTAEEQWSASRNLLQAEFNQARRDEREIVALIRTSRFREAFEPDGIDTSEDDLLAALAEDAGKWAGEHLLGLEAYAASVAPSVRAFNFVRDSGYNALLSLLSTRRVLQDSDVAGALARAAGVLQNQYEDDVRDAKACAAT